MITSILTSVIVGSICYLIGYQHSANNIWKIWQDATDEFPDSKMSEWKEVLKERPNLFKF
jgi:hypothetical protein